MEYRTFVPGIDDAAVLKLRANVWGAEHPHTTPEFMRWLLGITPAGAGSGVMMINGAEVLGFAGLLRREVQLDGESLTAAQCVDYMVHTGARAGAGSFRIMSAWTQLARDLGFAFGTGFPNANSREIVTRPRLGWREAFSPELMVRPLSGSAVPAFLARRIPSRLARFGVGLLATLANARAGLNLRNRPDGEPFMIDHFCPGFDILWQRAQAAGYSGIRRDAAYLNWRFVQQPVYSYLRVGWMSRNNVRGYAVASLRDVLGIPSMLVVDLLVEPGISGVAEALLEEVASRARIAGALLLSSLAIDNSAVASTLARAGFVAVPRRFNPKPFVMTAHDLGNRRPVTLSKDGWHFTWAEMDVV